ncbi:MAG: hypothetical protein AAFY60_03865 [Myxococcota bacterium]
MMNLVSILIPALLVSVSFVAIHVVNTRIAASADSPAVDEPACAVTLYRSTDAIRLESRCDGDGDGVIQSFAAGDHQGLAQALSSIQRLSPATETMTLGADSTVNLDVLTGLIDVSQGMRDPESGRAERFDHVLIAPNTP